MYQEKQGQFITRLTEESWVARSPANAHHTAISPSRPWSIASEEGGMEGWKDREERIEGGRRDYPEGGREEGEGG